MGERSSATTAAALREARRRNILENSANRLKLIEGTHTSLERVPIKSFLKPEPQLQVMETNTTVEESSSSEKQNSKLSDVIASDKTPQIPAFYFYPGNSKVHDIDEVDVMDFMDCPEELGSEPENVVTVTTDWKNKRYKNAKKKKKTSSSEECDEVSCLELCLEKRLHLIILALTTNILFFFNVGYLFQENIFLPFYTLITIELLFRRRVYEEFHLLIYLFILLLPKRVERYALIFFALTLPFLSDLCIYLFTFMIGIKLLNIQEQ